MSYADTKIISNSKYMKVEAGVPHDIRLLNDTPMEMFEHQTQPKPTQCQGQETCALCQKGDEPTQRFNTNVYDHTLKKVQIWKYGGGVAKQLKAIANSLIEEGGDILKTDLKVDVTGSNKQKRYTVTPRVNSKVVPDDLKLHDLEGDLPF